MFELGYMRFRVLVNPGIWLGFVCAYDLESVSELGCRLGVSVY